MAPRSNDLTATIVRKTPTNRKPMNTIEDWLEGKWADDGAEGLWRVHDKLYDLTTWVKNHPGGREWLDITKGTDITEAFECNHLSDRAEKILKKFYVRDARIPRNSLLTFHENGFFKTLKRKVRERKLITSTKPLTKTKLFADSLAVSVFVTGLLGTVGNIWWAVLSGVLLNMLAVCAHNFFHMRDNWRMHYFNLLLMSVSWEMNDKLDIIKQLVRNLMRKMPSVLCNILEWRVSHVLSHHLYPNTILDLEISMFEPIFRFLPDENKKFRYLSFVLSPIVMAFAAHFQFIRRIMEVFLSKKVRFRSEELVGFSLFFFLLLFGGQGIWKTFVVWNTIILTGSFSFTLVGLTAAHHHPDIYHDGDFLGNDKDFGLLQLAAVRDRIDVDGNFMKTLVMFGEHTLHHLFPTVDHGRLPALDGVLEETCKEFKINYKPLAAKNLFLGMFKQLIRNYLNSRLMILEH